jgi:hypothetical protein
MMGGAIGVDQRNGLDHNSALDHKKALGGNSQLTSGNAHVPKLLLTQADSNFGKAQPVKLASPLRTN